MNCPNCNKELNVTTGFCSYCGTNLKKEPSNNENNRTEVSNTEPVVETLDQENNAQEPVLVPETSTTDKISSTESSNNKPTGNISVPTSNVPVSTNNIQQAPVQQPTNNIGTGINQGYNQVNNKENVTKKGKSKLPIILIIIVVLILAAFLVTKFVINKSKKDVDIIEDKMVSVVKDDNGNVKFISGNVTDQKVKNESDAYKVLDSLKDEFKFKDAKKEFSVQSISTSENITFYRFKQKYNDIDVYGSDLILSADATGKVLSVNGYYQQNINIDTTTSRSKEEIESIVKTALGENAEITSSEQAIYADSTSQDLVYLVTGYSNDKANEYIVNAKTGEIILEAETMNYAKAYEYTDEGLKGKETVTIEEITTGDKTVYRFYDPKRKIQIVDARSVGDNFFSQLDTKLTTERNYIVGNMVDNHFVYLENDEEFLKESITTLKNFETIYDYYHNVLGRNSFDNKGTKIVVNLGVKTEKNGDIPMNNACWNRLFKQMFIGSSNGSTYSKSLDVSAHEFTHGVVQFTADLAILPKKDDYNKAFEAGALDESYSDILGSIIENKNWTMAEDNKTLRDLANPENYSNPKSKGGQYYIPDGYLAEGMTMEELLAKAGTETIADFDNGAIHNNSTVSSHAAYLMYESNAFKSKEEMAKVWYNSLFLLPSYASFEDCALAVLKTAQNLGLSDASIYKIRQAFYETKMLEDKNVTIKGKILDNDKIVPDATIEIYSYDKNTLITKTTSNDKGEYSLEIPTGAYKIVVKKKGYNDYTKKVNIVGDTTLDLNISYECCTIKIYYLDPTGTGKLSENYEVYKVGQYKKASSKEIVSYINKMFKSDILSTDGKTFYFDVGGMKIDVAWYYRGTDIKFDWDKPITENVEVEMKMLNGILDNDFFEGVSEGMNGGN